MKRHEMGFVGGGGGVAKEAPKPRVGLDVPSQPKPTSFQDDIDAHYDTERGVVPDLRRTNRQLSATQEVASHFADTSEGDAEFAEAGLELSMRGKAFDLNVKVETAEESFSEAMRKKETGGVSEEAGQQPDWSRMSQEMLDTRHETLMQKIGDLRARQMALDDALDTPSIQELSRVNQELTMREATLASLRKHMGK